MDPKMLQVITDEQKEKMLAKCSTPEKASEVLLGLQKSNDDLIKAAVAEQIARHNELVATISKVAET